MKYTAHIGLGSNLPSQVGPPVATARAVIHLIHQLGVVTAISSLYRTSPVEFLDQPNFINAAVRLKTGLEPDLLMRALLAVERIFGRERKLSAPKGPRTVDLDLLMVTCNGEPVIERLADLTLPHPEMAYRQFVLEPLTEIDPELVHPVKRKTVRELLGECKARNKNSAQEVTKLPSDANA